MGLSEVLQSTFILVLSDAAAVKFYTCVPFQVKNQKNSTEFPHMDFTIYTPNCLRTETSGHLLCGIILEVEKKKKFYNFVSLTLAS